MGVSLGYEDSAAPAAPAADMAGAAPAAGVSLSYGEETPKVAPEPETMEMPIVDPITGTASGGTMTVPIPKMPKYEEYPTWAEIPMTSAPSAAQKARLALGMPFSTTVEGKQNVIKENIPDAEFSADKYGNPLVIVGGQKYHLDRPDTFNKANIASFVPRAVVGAAAGLGAAGLGTAAGAGLVGDVLLQGAGGLLSYGTQKQLANISGAQETASVPEAAVETGAAMAGPVVGKAISTWYNLMKPEVFSQLPRGAQNFFSQNAKELQSSPQTRSMYAAADPAHDMILDDPKFANVAKEVMKTDSPGADVIHEAINARQTAAPARIMSDVDRTVGPLSVSDRQMAATMDNARRSLAPQLQTALNNAPAVNPSSVVAGIDAELQTAKGPVRNALMRVRNMLVLDEGSPATPAVRATTPTPGGQYVITPGRPAVPPTYETNPQALENARVAIDRMIRYGDADVPRGSISAQDRAIFGARDQLSEALKNNVPGYRQLMGRYSNIYSLMDAHEAGTNIFRTGVDALRPEQVAAMAADPATGNAFRLGARSAVNNKLRTSPNDIAALNRMTGDPMDFTRQNLETIYNPRAVERLQGIASREAQYNRNAADLIAARQEGINAKSAAMEQQANRPLMPETPGGVVTGAYQRAIRNPLNWAASKLAGQSEPAYNIGRGQFLTARGPTAEQMLLQSRTTPARNALIQQGAGTAAGIIGADLPAYIQSIPQGEKRGGRIGRASGGRVDPESAADQLVRAAELAKKNIGAQTESILNAPDEAVVRALKVANQNLEG